MSVLSLSCTNATDRRRSVDALPSRDGITPAQRQAIETLEYFGWRLRFVRQPLFRDPIPVLFELGKQRYVLVRGDGSLDESQSLTLRD